VVAVGVVVVVVGAVVDVVVVGAVVDGDVMVVVVLPGVVVVVTPGAAVSGGSVDVVVVSASVVVVVGVGSGGGAVATRYGKARASTIGRYRAGRGQAWRSMSRALVDTDTRMEPSAPSQGNRWAW